MIKVIGDHRVKCGSVMAGIDDLMGGAKADVIYSDPPWGQGNVKYWQTMNHKQTGAATEEIKFAEFLNQVFDIIAKYAAGPALIEYGQRWREEIEAQAKRIGFKILLRCESWYHGGGKLYPLDFYVMSRGIEMKIPEGYAADLGKLKGGAFSVQAIEPFAVPGGIVLDPMCGMGYTASAAMKHGMRFYGNELNANRLAKTIRRLERGR